MNITGQGYAPLPLQTKTNPKNSEIDQIGESIGKILPFHLRHADHSPATKIRFSGFCLATRAKPLKVQYAAPDS